MWNRRARRCATLSRKFVQPMMKCKFCPLFRSAHCMLIYFYCKVNEKIGARCANIEWHHLYGANRCDERWVTSIELKCQYAASSCGSLSLSTQRVCCRRFTHFFPIFLFYIIKKKRLLITVLNNFYVTQ